MSTLTDLDAEVAELRERLATVLRLHVRADCCTGEHAHLCTECWNAYPCPTVRAIDGYR